MPPSALLTDEARNAIVQATVAALRGTDAERSEFSSKLEKLLHDFESRVNPETIEQLKYSTNFNPMHNINYFKALITLLSDPASSKEAQELVPSPYIPDWAMIVGASYAEDSQ
jgi:hypothetical protein